MLEQNNELPFSANVEATPFQNGDQLDFHAPISENLRAIETARNLVRAANHATDTTLVEKQRVFDGPIELAKQSLQYTSLIMQMRKAEVGGMLMSEPLTKDDYELTA